MMSLPISAGNLTKTEDKDQHLGIRSAGDSLHSTFNQHGDMQVFKHGSNKEVPLSCGLEDSFHASFSSIMKTGELSSQPWSPNLSPFHPSEALYPEASQAFENRLSAVDEFGFDSGLLLGGRKEPSFRPPSASRQRPTYKYDDLPAADLSNLKPNEYFGSIRKQASPIEMTYPSQQNPNGTMAYQESWHNRFPNYGIPAADERVSVSPSTPLTQRDYITPVMGSRRASEQPMATNVASTMVSPTQHSPMSASCSESFNQCVEYPMSSSLAASSGHPAPIHLLRSQSEGSVMQPWGTQPIDTPMYSYPDQQTHGAQGWWGATSLPSRPLQPYATNGYSPMVMAPAPQRPHVTDAALSIPPLSCPTEPAVGPAYQLELTHDSLPRPSFLQNPGPPTPQTAPVSPGTTVPSMIPPRVHRSPKSRHHNTALQRRATARKASATSFPAAPNSKANKTMPPQIPSIPATSMAGGKNPVSVSFVNFTPEDSQKLLTGVAPSGSSKTKARREQEAKEKRRKLSEAALLAVRKAGGDVEALEAVLC